MQPLPQYRSNNLFFVVVLLCSIHFCRSQGVTTIGFDEPPSIPPASEYTITWYFEGGMFFAPIGDSTFGRVTAGLSARPQNGTAYLSTTAGQSLVFNAINGAAFDLLSVDLAEYSTVFPGPGTVHVTGFRGDGTIVSRDFVIDGINDGTGPAADFQTFIFGPDFSNLQRVEIPGYGWSLDNLVVNIPEPGIGSLGLGILIASIHKFKRRSQR